MASQLQPEFHVGPNPTCRQLNFHGTFRVAYAVRNNNETAINRLR